jgi:pSer/pThr/pTyr-binding forkhead associated (FHA) protein
MKVSLTVLVSGPMEGKRIPITLPRFVIGRGPQANLQPANPAISENHCALEVGEKLIARDLASATGTFVNDRRIEGAVELNNGDRLKIGPLVFGVSIEAEAVAPRQPAPAAPVPATPAAAPAPAVRSPTPLPPTIPRLDIEGEQPQAPSPDAAKKPASRQGDTALAAKELLKKYLRRKRSEEPLD